MKNEAYGQTGEQTQKQSQKQYKADNASRGINE